LSTFRVVALSTSKTS